MTIETIREKLRLSRLDMSMYLGVSIHMVKAIELGNRKVPMDSLDAVAALINAILADDARGTVATDVVPATPQQIRLMKRLHGTYSRRLRKYTRQLQKMQTDYAEASRSLGILQRFATTLPLTTARDRAQQKWVKLKIHELTHRINQNNLTAQEILSLEIAGLKLRIERLEGSGLIAVKILIALPPLS